MKRCCLLLWGAALVCWDARGAATNFLEVVCRYAATMIEHGRDTYGPQQSGLLLSALDRTTSAR